MLLKLETPPQLQVNVQLLSDQENDPGLFPVTSHLAANWAEDHGLRTMDHQSQWQLQIYFLIVYFYSILF